MRGRFSCSGIFELSVLELSVYNFAENEAQPNRQQAGGDGNGDVAPGPKPLAGARQVECLQAEGGKGGVAAANAYYAKLHDKTARCA